MLENYRKISGRLVSEESWRPVEADRQATTQFKKCAGPGAQRK